MPPESQAPAEPMEPTAPAAPAEGSQAQTVEVPLSAVPNAQEGGSVEFKVVSIDTQSGVVTLAPAESEPVEEAEGSDGMAAQFSKDKLQEGMM